MDTILGSALYPPRRAVTMASMLLCKIFSVSEPELKPRSSKLTLRQMVLQRNSPLERRREQFRKRSLATGDENLCF